MHFALCILLVQSASAVDINTYYASLNGKSGKALFDAVHTVAKVGYSDLGYKGLWTAYAETDLYPEDTVPSLAGKVWDMYSNCPFTYQSKQCGNYGRECDCYNREHSIPKSWFGGAQSQPGSDIFHIVPTDGKVNGMRGNQPFGEVASASYTHDESRLGTAKSITITNTILGASHTATCNTTVFEPADRYKGDFARGYFGTMVRWAGDYQMFTTEDGAMMFSNGYDQTNNYGLTPYGIALLMKWHREDAVSRKEIDRNNGIQQTQGNRNPFIDLPELAEYIWGQYAGQTYNLPDSVSPVEQTKEANRGERKLINGKLVITLHGRSYNAQGLRY